MSGPHMIHFKPITALNKMVSSKRGSLEKGSGDAFLPCPSKTDFSGPQYNPLDGDHADDDDADDDDDDDDVRRR